MVPDCAVVTGIAVLGTLLPLELTAVTVMKYVVNGRSVLFPLPFTVILVEAPVVLTEPEYIGPGMHAPSWLARSAKVYCTVYLSAPD